MLEIGIVFGALAVISFVIMIICEFKKKMKDSSLQFICMGVGVLCALVSALNLVGLIVS